MNAFLKGLKTAPDIVERVIDKSPMDYYDLKEKTILVVKMLPPRWQPTKLCESRAIERLVSAQVNCL